MENKSTRELFDLLKSKLIIELKDGEELCPDCKGLRLSYKEHSGKRYIETCRTCHTGKVYKCEFCGSLDRNSMCYCKQASDKRSNDLRMREHTKFQEVLKTATIIPIKQYKGYLTSLYNEERVVEADEFMEQYLDEFDVELSGKYVYASIGEPLFNLDIYDIISDKCEEGYEGMYQRLTTESELLADVQVLLDKWSKLNEGDLKVYGETNDIIVDLTELYEEGLSKL